MIVIWLLQRMIDSRYGSRCDDNSPDGVSHEPNDVQEELNQKVDLHECLHISPNFDESRVSSFNVTG